MKGGIVENTLKTRNRNTSRGRGGGSGGTWSSCRFPYLSLGDQEGLFHLLVARLEVERLFVGLGGISKVAE